MEGGQAKSSQGIATKLIRLTSTTETMKTSLRRSRLRTWRYIVLTMQKARASQCTLQVDHILKETGLIVSMQGIMGLLRIESRDKDRARPVISQLRRPTQTSLIWLRRATWNWWISSWTLTSTTWAFLAQRVEQTVLLITITALFQVISRIHSLSRLTSPSQPQMTTKSRLHQLSHSRKRKSRKDQINWETNTLKRKPNKLIETHKVMTKNKRRIVQEIRLKAK